MDTWLNFLTKLPLTFFIASLLPLLLLWWLAARRDKSYQSEIQVLTDRVNYLEAELYACRKHRVEVLGYEVQTAAPNAEQQKDDLKIVEGIGPKIEELLHQEGIFTFHQLSHLSPKLIRQLLEKAGSRFLMHDPTTWPEQALLAHEGKWDALKKWQSELNKGRRVN